MLESILSLYIFVDFFVFHKGSASSYSLWGASGKDEVSIQSSEDITVGVLIWLIYSAISIYVVGVLTTIVELVAGIRGIGACQLYDVDACESALGLSKALRVTRAVVWSALFGVFAGLLPGVFSRSSVGWEYVIPSMIFGALAAVTIQAYFSLIFLGYKEELKDHKPYVAI
eukprot:CAMPEP_0114988866 /NCGR_PEP_ID=MMETSP0216-20121206/9859_1 /TAXON_ID=223996 /ORGANISM="Protocruzia adherens, Strain Boccale" /LENGTH=170 /DNA_ID=CAMNT_0002351739 /DNA_START=210 /DNA_END=722 /DNA_ORIENTATION=+